MHLLPLPIPLLLLLSVSLSSAAPHPSTPGAFSLPLSVKRRSLDHPTFAPDDRLASLLAQRARLRRKYGIADEDEGDRLARRAVTVGEEDLAGNDMSYYGSITLGTPPITYEVGMDTGSADLVIATSPSSLCGTLCTPTAPLYSPSNSSSATQMHTTVSITYGTGGAQGVLVKDTMGLAGFSSTQVFAACDNVTGLTSSSDQAGLLGLGWKSLAATGATPFVQQLFQSGSLAQPLFALGLRALDEYDIASSTSVVSGGILTIGGLNSTLYTGPINHIPLNGTAGYWSIPIEGVMVGNQSTGFSNNGVVIDTGTNAITLPSDVADSIYALIPESQSVGNGLYTYPCATQVTLTFTFGGQPYPMAPKFFNSGPSDSTGRECYGIVSTLGDDSSPSPWIIGSPFLMNYYSVFQFSPPSVGFASLSSSASGALEGVAIPTSGVAPKTGTEGVKSSGAIGITPRAMIWASFVVLGVMGRLG